MRPPKALRHSCWAPLHPLPPPVARDGACRPLRAPSKRRLATAAANTANAPESAAPEFASLFSRVSRPVPPAPGDVAEERRRLAPLGPIGQPTFLSHPHLLQAGEITTGISRQEYRERRSNLMKAVPEGSIAIVGGYGVRYMTGGIFYPFRQNSDLLYLTGCEEPDCAVVLLKDSSAPNGHRFVMFVRPKERNVELWDGPRIGLDGCRHFFEADEAHPISNLQSYLRDLVADKIRTSVTDPPREDREACFSSFVRRLTLQEPEEAAAPASDDSKSSGWWSFSSSRSTRRSRRAILLRPLKMHLQELRAIKSPAECDLMLRAGRITGLGFRHLMSACRPGATEHQLCAAFDGHVRTAGASRMAYVPVVAGGRNALTLHYVHNRARLEAGDLVLVDAGVEYGGYVSDVTRTLPVSGRFSEPQRKLYEALLRVQKAAVEQCTESAKLSLDDIHSASHQALRRELEALFGRMVTAREMDRLYPHHIGHWLGMDVHDGDGIPRSRKLKKGMVVTIEPGVYVPPSPEYPPEYQNIGIRIEDDVLVGLKGSLALSASAPKDVDEIEELMTTTRGVQP
ncbi:peptidase M24, structural domain-containing protein [Hyaloraphidium curvatum]|nr:peptidase M24, structural domain-containing protein [Hyaloraphidium curvatum]